MIGAGPRTTGGTITGVAAGRRAVLPIPAGADAGPAVTSHAADAATGGTRDDDDVELYAAPRLAWVPVPVPVPSSAVAIRSMSSLLCGP
jgi:hypothetical protein